MAKTLSASLIQQKNKLDTRNPWVVAIDVVINPDPANYLEEHLTNNNENLEWGGVTYKCAPFKLGTMPSKSSGELPEVTLSMFNTLELAEFLYDYNGLIDHEVTVHLVYAVKDANGIWYINEDKNEYPLTTKYIIKSCQVSRNLVAFVVGTPNYLQRPFPARLYHRDFCDFAYKGDYCWVRPENGFEYDQDNPVEVAKDYCNNIYEDCKRHYKNFGLDNDPAKVGIGYGGFPNIRRGSYIYR